MQHFIVAVNHRIIIRFSRVFNRDVSKLKRNADLFFSTAAQFMRWKRQSEAGAGVFY